MKKFLLVLLISVMTCCVACGEKQVGTQQKKEKETVVVDSNNTDNKQDSTRTEKVEITLENVMSAPESPESDFEVIEYSEEIIELSKYLGDDEIVVIPETVNGKAITRLGAYVFANDYHPNVKAVKLSDSIKTIDDSAFGLNQHIEIVVTGTQLELISEGAFQGCSNLHTVSINDKLITLEGASFVDCKKLKSIYLPMSTVEIHPLAFYDLSEDFVIYGENGSAAEEFAASQGITFKVK